MKTKIHYLLLLVFSISYAQIPTTNLVGHYDFSNGALTDNINNANFTKTGTAATTITDRFGNINEAISLNGDDLTRPDINFNLTNSSPYLSQTISFWIKTATNDANTRIIYNDNDQVNTIDNTFDGVRVYLKNGQIFAALRDNAHHGNYITHTTNVSDNVWHHVVIQVSVTNTSGTKRIITHVYIDTVKEGGTTLLTNTMSNIAPNHSGNISFSRLKGASVTSNEKYEDGIDEVLFYTRLLSDAEVNTISGCTVNIPDANFKAYLVGNTAINTNGDTEIQCSEATAFTGLISCSSQSISDLTGIETFINLTELHANDNQLTSIDISNNTVLETLFVSLNNLTTLDVSSNTVLERLSLFSNSLTSLDISANSVLTLLIVGQNSLTSLNAANGNNSSFSNFEANRNPNLTCVQVDNPIYSTANWTIIDAQTSFSTNCSASATTIAYVNHAAAFGANNGTTWADAYAHLEDALTAATDGSEIWIATGTYLPNTSALINTPFNVNNADLKIYGGFAGTETQLSDRVLGTNETILSGDFQANDVFVNDHFTNSLFHSSKTDNSRNIINITALANNLVLDGLTISNAHNSVNNIYGGAVIKEKTVAKLTIKNCTIKNNIAALAAPGVYAQFDLNNVAGTRGELIIENSKFINNMSRFASGVYAYALTNTLLDITVENSLFNNNIAGNRSTGVRGLSGAASWFRSIGANADVDLKLINNTYVNHLDDSDGNGINNYRRAVVAINTSAGVLNAEVVNCIFWNNFTPSTTSTINVRSITNTYQDAAQSIVVKNSIDKLNFNDTSITSTVNTSNANPIFTNLNSDFTLQTGSPAVDTGDNSYVTTASDLLGNQRIFNGTVDMGIYEFGASSLGVEDNVLLENFKLYPNPVRNTLNIQLEETLDKIEVYSLLERKVLVSNNTHTNVSNLSSGLYLLKVYSQDGKVGVKRFIKE